jgi:hypothetical protein
MKSAFKTVIWPVVISVFLAACGGGGGSDSGSTNPPIQPANNAPSVSAGPSQNVVSGDEVTLNGSASDSDGSIASYSWEQTNGVAVSLSSTNSATVSFTAPDGAASLEFRLTATDNDGASSSSLVAVDVLPPVNATPMVDAGGNQGVLLDEAVTLTGSASDSDGSIISYLWEQTAGDPVSLSGADSANLSFTSPNAISSLEFQLTVTDNEGATATDTVTVYVGERQVSVSGAVTFDLVPLNSFTSGLDYDNTVISPARGIVIAAIGESGEELSSATTDSNGEYQFTIASNTFVRLRISARILKTTGSTYDVQIADNTNGNALYVTEGEQFNTGLEDHIRDFYMASGWDGTGYSGPRSAGPFAILDAIYETVEKFGAAVPTAQFPALEIRWSENNNPASGNLEDGDVSTSFYNGNNIYVLGAADTDSDEYDRHVVIHEWGHYFEGQMSRADSIGGPHATGERLDMRVAFGEGWGNALSAMITDDPYYRDSFGTGQSSGFSIRVETNSQNNPGWFNEGSVQSILYDLYDVPADGADSINLGLAPIFETLVSSEYRNTDYFTSIFSFVDRLKTLQPDSVAQIDALLSAQTINGAGPDGAGETNDGGIASALPVYNTALVGGSAMQLCSTNEAGSYNKLANRAYVDFDISSTGSYNFSATDTSALPVSDPDFIVYKQNSYIAIAESSAVGTEVTSINFTSTGKYRLELYDWNNVDDNDSAGSTCFDFQITN